MTKDELLKIYSAYLPYGLQISTDDEGEYWVETVIGVNNEALETSVGNYWDFTVKPILYDLSYLTKEIEHEGESFIPSVKIKEETITGYTYNYFNLIEIKDFKLVNYEVFQKLLEWHLNVFGLPEYQFINKATLTNK